MKIQCDVCSKDEAAVFCTADEAALCDACDHRVHHANKLASKHHRFSLLHPSSKNFPLCDVCQEKRAFLFCQQDRAILCRDCDAPIHKANEHTQKHNRYLLTGVKLSATPAVYVPSSSGVKDLVPDHSNSQQSTNKPTLPLKSNNNNPNSSTPALNKQAPPLNTVVNKTADTLVNNEEAASVSSISEYLMETLPGWHVEDFLDFPSSNPLDFFKADEKILSFGGADDTWGSIGSETAGIWVPQAPTAAYPSQQFQQMGSQIGLKETSINTRTNSRRWSDDALTVPQISPPSIGSKRSRPFW